MDKSLKVPEDYVCPLCPDHEDDTFFYSNIVGELICEGCMTEISYFVEEYGRPDDFVLDGLVALTGLSFPEFKRISIEEFVEDFENRLKPENVSGSRRPR